ncbi:MAG: SdpI family protein [Candidatus Micrarchaeota archaeon]
MEKRIFFALALVVVCFLVGTLAYSTLPENIATHWNLQDKADGSMPKQIGLFLIPALGCVLIVLFKFLPNIDPMGASYAGFRRYYDEFVVVIMGFLLYLEVLIVVWNAGTIFSMGQVLAPALAAVFYFTGRLAENTKRNWFVGIRTPWTITSDVVWNKTNVLTGKLMKAAGIIALFGVILPSYAFGLVLVPVILAAVFGFAYSYLEYKKIKQ